MVAQDKLSKPQEKKNTAKPKKDTRKWCESEACSESESEPNKGNEKGKLIIDVEPNTTVANTKIQKD